MQAIGYYIALPFLYLISALPSFLFYGLSDFIFFLLYYVVGYRKEIVMTNLRNSFPKKSEAELKAISIRYYHYLCDLTLETFRTLTLPQSYFIKHCGFSKESNELFDKYYDEKKSVMVVMGHYGNWEWSGNSFSLICKQQLYVIYHPLENKYWNTFIVNLRTRFGTKLIPMKDTFREMVRNRNEINATSFIADQTPSSTDSAYWTNFLHQDTPVFRGIETIARKMNYPVVYAAVRRVKRGYYEIFAETLFEEPAKTQEGEITKRHTRRLEEDIRKQPEIWLWSHRRWKHKRIMN